MEKFIEDYENIHQTLKDLIDQTEDEDLKTEVYELLSVFEEDYKNEREKCEEALEDEARIEARQEEYSWNLDRL